MHSSSHGLLIKFLLTAVAAVFALGLVIIPSKKVNADVDDPIQPGQTIKIDYSEDPVHYLTFTLEEDSYVNIIGEGILSPSFRLYSVDDPDFYESYGSFFMDFLKKGSYRLKASIYNTRDEDYYATLNAYPADNEKVADVDENSFPDPVLRQKIKQNVDLDGNNILTVNELKAIYYFSGTHYDNSSDDYIYDFKGIEYLSSVKSLYIDNQKASSIDLSNMSELVTFNCRDSCLTSLDLSNNPKIERIYVDWSPLSELNVDGCNELVQIDIQMTNMEILDLSLPNLRSITCGSYGSTDYTLKILDVSRCPKLVGIRCTNCPNLEKMYLPKPLSEYKPSSSYVGPDPFGGNNAKGVVLTEDDWKYEGVTWTGSEDSGYSKAVANYKCTNPDALNYEKHIECDLTSKQTSDATCEKAGTVEYKAVLAAGKARDGKAVNEPNTAYIPAAKGHKWGEWKVSTPATVEKPGTKTRSCSVCGKTETADISKLTPTPTTKPAADPTKKAEPTKASEPSVSLTLNKTKAEVVCGKNLTLKATLKGSSAKITWKSSDTKVAAVDANGKITTKMAGTVTITAAAAGKTATCVVTVLYKDVTNSKDFWYNPTNYLTTKGVVKGYDKQTKFKPANVCTRAQMVTFIWRLQGEPKPKTSKCKFSDVKKTDYFYKACIWGNEKHIVEGYKDGTFGPKIVCARRHAVTFLWRLAGQPKPSSSKNKFKDVKEKDYYYKACLWASEKGILAGYSDGTFRPNGDCLRRQMVTFLYKYDKFVNGKG